MSAESERELRAIQISRSRYLACFKDYPDILAWILNYCGHWSQDPAKAKPDLVAFSNALLGEMGVVHEANLVTMAKALMLAANDNDIAAIRKAEAEKKEE